MTAPPLVGSVSLASTKKKGWDPARQAIFKGVFAFRKPF